MMSLLAWRKKRGLRIALLGLYKKFLGATSMLPDPVRSWFDVGSSLVLLSVANTHSKELETTLERAVDLLLQDKDRDTLGDYLEFGVCFGWSLAAMHQVTQRRGLERMRLIGFDSFEGLPAAAKADDGGYWSPRMFKADIRLTRRFLNKAGVDWSRVTLIQGWFSETLNHATKEKLKLKKASVIMVDCDMYQSAREALAFCGPLIDDDAVVIFDDWYSGGLDQKNLGEKRAFEEFLSGDDFVAEPICRYGPNARVFKLSRRQRGRQTATWIWGILVDTATKSPATLADAVQTMVPIAC